MTDLNLLSLSIGLGLAVSLLLTELFGIAAGGLVVPGYVALYLNQPLDVALTLIAAFGTFAIVRLASSFVIIYGRRRTVLMILIGYAVGAGINLLTGGGFEVGPQGLDAMIPPEAEAEEAFAATQHQPLFIELSAIGYIVPGLIAIWIDRQGIVPTVAALLTTAVVVRLLLIMLVPTELQWFEASQPAALPFWLPEVLP